MRSVTRRVGGRRRTRWTSRSTPSTMRYSIGIFRRSKSRVRSTAAPSTTMLAVALNRGASSWDGAPPVARTKLDSTVAAQSLDLAALSRRQNEQSGVIATDPNRRRDTLARLAEGRERDEALIGQFGKVHEAGLPAVEESRLADHLWRVDAGVGSRAQGAAMYRPGRRDTRWPKSSIRIRDLRRATTARVGWRERDGQASCRPRLRLNGYTPTNSLPKPVSHPSFLTEGRTGNGGHDEAHPADRLRGNAGGNGPDPTRRDSRGVSTVRTRMNRTGRALGVTPGCALHASRSPGSIPVGSIGSTARDRAKVAPPLGCAPRHARGLCRVGSVGRFVVAS